jgi:hypothetical protein
VPFLKDHFKPESDPDPRELGQRISALDHGRFAVREQAVKELEEIGDVAMPALRKALVDNPTLEVRKRVDQLLRKLEGPATGRVLRGIRAVGILEYVGSAEAKEVLESLAKGAPRSRITQEARDALKRFIDR